MSIDKMLRDGSNSDEIVYLKNMTVNGSIIVNGIDLVETIQVALDNILGV